MIKNVEKLPKNVRTALERYVGELAAAGGDNVISVFAYGSVTGPDYDPRHSDVNLGVVLKSAALEDIEPFQGTIKTGLKKRINVPLFLTLEYIKKSLDTFPIEFSDMKETSVVLFGGDVISAVKVDDHNVRRECEHQLKGKVLMLRQAYLEHRLNRWNLAGFTKASSRALLPVFRALVRIKRGAPSGFLSKADTFKALSDDFGIDVKVLARAAEGEKVGAGEVHAFFALFLKQLENLFDIVDKM